MGTLLLMVDEAPLSVEWRTPDGRNRPNHVWVSQNWWGRLGWDSQESSEVADFLDLVLSAL